MVKNTRMGLNQTYTLTKIDYFRIVSDRPAHGFGCKVK